MAQKDGYLEAAALAADWLLNNQLRDEMDANRGRVLEFVDKATGKSRYTRSWDSGIAILALLAMHSATGEARYLEAATLAGEYVKSLQCLDAAQPLLYGAFRELTPQTPWLHPRDTASAGWGLLGLYRATRDADCLRRAELCADWFLQQAMTTGYPPFTIGLREKDRLDLRGAFQCGGMAFICDLARVTGKRSLLERIVKPVCDIYLTQFMRADGSIRTIVDPNTGDDSGARVASTWPAYFRHMFAHNDDFAAIALLKAVRELREARYLQAAEKFLRRLARLQNDDGSLGSPPVVSACGTGILEWSALDETSGDGEFSEAIRRAADYMLTRQERESADVRLRGGVYGLDVPGEAIEARATIHCRSTLYALLAWVRVSGAARFNPI
jgi:uncharacterized protein YyaL (SSP411 family)